MSTFKNLIATVLFTSVAAASFAQAPAVSADAKKTVPAVVATSAPVASVKHTAKKVPEPVVKDVAATAPTEAASKPAHKAKKAPAKKAPAATPATPASK
jgi:hypothetical protein